MLQITVINIIIIIIIYSGNNGKKKNSPPFPLLLFFCDRLHLAPFLLLIGNPPVGEQGFTSADGAKRPLMHNENK